MVSGLEWKHTGPHQVCLMALVDLLLREQTPSQVWGIYLQPSFGSAPPDTNPAWSGITDSVPTSLLSPFERGESDWLSSTNG